MSEANHSICSSTAASLTTDDGDELILTYDTLDEARALRFVRHPSAGATCVFVGTTRNTFAGRAVEKLEYEAYTKLALKTMRSVAARARAGKLIPPVDKRDTSSAQYGPTVTRIHISHRLGTVPVGESSIVVAVSSPHRRESFEVAEWLLEQVKREVQIWKREVYTDAQQPTWKANFP